MGQGNQMFQYAAGRALSLHSNLPYKLDTSTYEGYKVRRYELSDYFEIDTPIISKEELLSFQYTHPVKRLWNKLAPQKNKLKQSGLGYEAPKLQRSLLAFYNSIQPAHKRLVYEEPHYHFDENFFNANSHIFLRGYWMSYKYFAGFEDAIRKDFTVRPHLVEYLEPTVEKMQQENSVSVLFRRGDLMSNPSYTKLKGIIPLSFYQEALNQLEQQFGSLNIYLFSDEIEWVINNLKTKHHVIPVSDHLAKNSLEQFYLLTKCKYNIIGNSTFAWWGAWLNNNPDKQVYAPSGWYSPYTHYDFKDVYPADWKIIEHPFWDGAD
jgi:hypothetical protein